MRQVQESQPKHVQEVMSATRGGRAPPTAVREKTGVRASLERGLPDDDNFIPVQVSAYEVPALGGDCSYSRKDCHSAWSPYCRLAVKRLEHLWTARASPDIPGRGEASVAINLTSPWKACPSVQIRNAWHTLLCIHNHLPMYMQRN